ncbi:MAG: hypothetical protein E7453_00705 [Ruminococcaceae bacterium]|nr:hypothetical protein [Oscillospiraceae bacterium]
MKSKILTFCLCLLLAIGIWIYVITVVSPESQDTFQNIPVQMQNIALLEERGFVITDISNTNISLTLSGKRTDLIQINSSNIRVIADVSNINEPGVHEIYYTVSFPGSIASGAIETQSRSPDTIRVTVEKKVSKRLDVMVEYTGAVPSGFMTDEASIQLSTKTVMVSGSQAALDKVTGAKVSVDLTNRTESISETCPVMLLGADGSEITDESVVADVSNVHVLLPIRMLKQVGITYDLIYGGGANTLNTTITSSADSILVAGHKNVLEDISDIKLGTIDLTQHKESVELTIPITLPEGVRNESDIHEVTLTITFNGLETKTLSVSNFKAVNVPEGMRAVFMESRLHVTIRGTKEDLALISASNIYVEVDFSATREGISRMPAKIIIVTNQITRAGAIGSYTLMADMQRIG